MIICIDDNFAAGAFKMLSKETSLGSVEMGFWVSQICRHNFEHNTVL